MFLKASSRRSPKSWSGGRGDEARLLAANSHPMDEVNHALHAGMTGPRTQNVETKYSGPNGEMIDVSETGWVGTRGLD